MGSQVRRERTERGATAVIVAGSMFLLLGMAALAIDLGTLRMDIRADRLASDAAVTAGVAAIDPFAGTGVVQACETAWEYLLLNLRDEGVPAAPPECSAHFSGPCVSDTARTAPAEAGPYSVSIVHPVPDSHPMMGSQPIVDQFDGVACQRLGVTIERTRDHYFASLMGFNTGSTTVHSVARAAPDAGGGEVVPLLVLEPIACSALFTSGQGKVTVTYDLETGTPGFIVVDSDASACSPSNPYSIESKGTQKGWIRAIPVPGQNIPSAILSYALAGIPPADPDASYNPSNLTDPVNPADIIDPNEPPESWFRLYPRPQMVSQRITRAPIDWRYNCKTGYPDYPKSLSNAGLGGIPVPDCLDQPAPHIDNLVAAYGGSQPLPLSFQTWTDEGHSCNLGSDLSLSGNWYIDCPSDLVVNGANLTFTDSNLVLDGGIDLRSSAVMKVNEGADETQNYFVFSRGGTILKRAQSSLLLEHTFVYLANGKIDLRAGDGGLIWAAPVGGNFEDLALWSEAKLTHQIGGQAGNTLTGTFFTPFAEPFTLTGQADQLQFEAQFITRRLEVTGQGIVTMIPNPDRSTAIPIRAVKLIR